MGHLVEICVENIKSVENAISGGAYRVEACSALELGGLTPSIGFVEHALSYNKIKVNVLIRPVAGNFVYTDEEFEIMCYDIKRFKEIGVNGIVSGILTKNGDVDIERSLKLIELSKPLEFTFHRAFDNCRNPHKAIKDIISIGADRILTSGQQQNVTKGMQQIIDFQKEYGNLIKIMPGGGVNKDNAQILLDNGIKELHLSAGKFYPDNSYVNSDLGGMGYVSYNNIIGYKYSDIKTIKEIVNL